MPSWIDVLNEVNSVQAYPIDVVRRKWLKKLQEETGRNIIAYYSGFLTRNEFGVAINDMDINGFMAVIRGLDRSKGLDLILHTPGGEIAATEHLVHYLKQMFDNNIRAIVPQIALSAGTMLACSCKSIIMGKQSCLGPIDPQFSGISAQGVIDEFNEAICSVKQDPQSAPIWKTVVEKYHPTFVSQCRVACERSSSIVRKWLEENMLETFSDKESIAQNIVSKLTKIGHGIGHDRHINKDEAKGIGLTVEDLEDNQNLQDLILTVHHAFIHTFSNGPILKGIENHEGIGIFNYAKQN